MIETTANTADSENDDIKTVMNSQRAERDVLSKFLNK